MLSTQLNRAREALERTDPSVGTLMRTILLDEHRDSSALYDQEKIDLIQRTHRFVTECLLNVKANPELESELSKHGEASWNDQKALKIPPEQMMVIAAQLFKSSRAERGDRIVIATTAQRSLLIEQLAELCEINGVDFDFDFQEPARQAILAKHLSDTPESPGQPSKLQLLAETRLALYRDVRKTIQVLTNPDPRVRALSDPAQSQLLTDKFAPLGQRSISGDLHYILTYLPTEQDAELDGLPYADYLQLFLEACDQPWEAIKEAQNILKEKFDRARRIHITNEDGTDITLDITGQTFANSVVLKNLPGSEIFSAPLKEGVNGKIVSKGRFQFRNSGVIEDITLVFERGRIVDFDARVGRDALAEIIQIDDAQGEGSRFLGEIGIGTNPHLRRHMINPLLVEKIGGSFHVAPGSCYSYTEYDGEPVQLQNGNTSKGDVHWDITTLLRGKQGKIELFYGEDDREKPEAVQVNGEWQVAGIDVLNQGWGAMPEAERPSWWDERYPQGYETVQAP